MDTLVEKQKSNHNQSPPFPVAFSFIMQFFLLLAGFHTLSEDELANAGIRHERYRSD
jgi:hypothetical protein